MVQAFWLEDQARIVSVLAGRCSLQGCHSGWTPALVFHHQSQEFYSCAPGRATMLLSARWRLRSARCQRSRNHGNLVLAGQRMICDTCCCFPERQRASGGAPVKRHHIHKASALPDDPKTASLRGSSSTCRLCSDFHKLSPFVDCLWRDCNPTSAYVAASRFQPPCNRTRISFAQPCSAA